ADQAARCGSRGTRRRETRGPPVGAQPASPERPGPAPRRGEPRRPAGWRCAEENLEVRRVGEPHSFDFTPKAHWDLGLALGIVDFERATKIARSRFAMLLGAGARMARALIDFMLDLHTREHGYTEVEPPFLVNAASLTGTG